MSRFCLALVVMLASVSCGSSTPSAPSPTPSTTTNPSPTPTTAVLSGTVTSQSGARLPGATVEVTSGTSSGQKVVTDTVGNYRFDALPTGSTTLKASATGYTDSTRTVTINGT